MADEIERSLVDRWADVVRSLREDVEEGRVSVDSEALRQLGEKIEAGASENGTR